MTARSTDLAFGTIAKAFHWTTVLLVIATFTLGVVMHNLTEPGMRLALYRIHAVLGLAILATTLARLIWRLIDRPPAAAALTRTERLLSRLLHGLLYVALIGLPVSGIATLVQAGAIPALLGAAGAQLPAQFALVGPRAAHGTMTFILFGAVILHVAAALRHHLLRKDDVLTRMWPGGGANRSAAP